MIYLHTSALVNLVVQEDETDALRLHLRTRRTLRPFSSMLAHAELLRAVQGAGPAAVSTGRQVLGGLDLVDVTREILEAAGTLRSEVRLGTLDAIHLATAMAADDRLVEMIVYDDRLRSAAVELGLPTAAPA
jgi:predicted nucleic acid-binding protein